MADTLGDAAFDDLAAKVSDLRCGRQISNPCTTTLARLDTLHLATLCSMHLCTIKRADWNVHNSIPWKTSIRSLLDPPWLP